MPKAITSHKPSKVKKSASRSVALPSVITDREHQKMYMKLHKQIAKLKVEQIADRAEIKALNERLKHMGAPDLGESLRRAEKRLSVVDLSFGKSS